MRCGLPLACLLWTSMVALAPIGSADGLLDGPQSPTGLKGEYDEGNNTLHLTWHPPGPAANTTYHVYRNGLLVAETSEPRYEAGLPYPWNIFQVTSVQEGNESAPSGPVTVFQQAWNGPVDTLTKSLDAPLSMDIDGMCEPVGTHLSLQHPPFFFLLIYEDCIPLVGDQLSIGPPVDLVWWT